MSKDQKVMLSIGYTLAACSSLLISAMMAFDLLTVQVFSDFTVGEAVIVGTLAILVSVLCIHRVFCINEDGGDR